MCSKPVSDYGPRQFQEHLLKQLNVRDQEWSSACCHLGDVCRVVHDDERARQYYEESLDLAQRLADLLPNDAEYAQNLCNTSERLGDLYHSRYYAQRALEFYSKSLEIRQRLAQQFPASADYAHDLSESLGKMGDVSRALGDGFRARQFHERSLDICELLVEQNPRNAVYAQNLATAYRKMASSVCCARPLDGKWWWRLAYDRCRDQVAALNYLYRAYKTLSGMRDRRWYTSADDERALKRVRSYMGAVSVMRTFAAACCGPRRTNKREGPSSVIVVA